MNADKRQYQILLIVAASICAIGGCFQKVSEGEYYAASVGIFATTYPQPSRSGGSIPCCVIIVLIWVRCSVAWLIAWARITPGGTCQTLPVHATRMLPISPARPATWINA